MSEKNLFIFFRLFITMFVLRKGLSSFVLLFDYLYLFSSSTKFMFWQNYWKIKVSFSEYNDFTNL